MADGIQIGALTYDLNIKDDNVGKQLDANDKKVQEFGKSVSSTGENLRNNLNKAAAGFAVVGAGLTLVAKNATDFTVDLVKSSTALGRQIGVTTEEASRLTAAFGRMGVSGENASQMFGIFSKNIVAATKSATQNQTATEGLRIEIDKTKFSIAEVSEEIKANGDKTGALGIKLRELNNTLAAQQQKLSENADGFAKLGVSTLNAAGQQKGFTEILFEVADKFQAMPDGIDKTALSLELFGRSGKEMLKVLNLGSQGIMDLEREADKLGLTLSADTIGKIQELVQSQKDLKQTTDATKVAIGTATAPVLTEFNQILNDTIQSALGADGPIRSLTIGFLAFGGPVFSGASAMLALGANMIQVAPAMARLANALRITAAAQVLLNIAMWANPIGIIIGLIAAAAVGIYLLYQNSETFRNGFIATWNSVLGLLQVVWSWIQGNWPYLLGALFGPFGIAAAWVSQHWEQVLNFFRSIPGAIASAFGTVFDAITAPFRAAFKAVVGYWNSTVGRISFTAPDWVPGVGGKGWSFPKFASGGIATSPTFGMFGEAGTEAVLPLSYLDRYNNLFDRIEKMATGRGNSFRGGDTIVNIGTVEDRQDADYIIRRIDRNSELEGMGVSPMRI